MLLVLSAAALRAEPAVVIGSFADVQNASALQLSASTLELALPVRDIRTVAYEGDGRLLHRVVVAASGFISDAGIAAGSSRAGVCRRLGCRRYDRHGRIPSLSGTTLCHPVIGYVGYPSFGANWAGNAAALSQQRYAFGTRYGAKVSVVVQG